jgi:hypothetical protein
MRIKTTMALTIATILTTYISAALSNQAFAQPGPIGGGGGGGGSGGSGGVPSGGNGGDGYIAITLFGQSASNSGLPGQIQTHPNIASILRAQDHTITPTYIRNLLITTGMQNGYFVGSGALLGQSASYSGHVGHSGLPGR